MAERRDGVQVLARAAQLLRSLAAEPEGLTSVELADRVGLPRSTAYRIVGTLCEEGFMRVTPSGKLRIGPGLVGLAVAGRRDLRHEAAPCLERLSRELRETVELVVLDGEEALFTDQYVPARSLRVVAEVGDRFPLHCTACGKALLAELPHAECERLLPGKLSRHTPHTTSAGTGSSRNSTSCGSPASPTIIRSTPSACPPSPPPSATRAAAPPPSPW